MLHTYPLHFIGKGLYSKEDFIIESERVGINRALPSFMLKKMNWGSPIKFTRTLTYVELDTEILGEEVKDKRVGFIGDYEQRKYFLKSEVIKDE